MLSSPISFSSVGEIENGQSLGLENSCLRRLLCEYSDNSKIKSTAGSTAPSARSTTTDTSSSTTTSSALSTCRKRVVADEDDDSLPDEHNGGSKRPKNGPRPWPKIDQRLACPFRKRDPHKYNIHAHRVCASRGWDSISRVKEHLYRCHLARPYCPRCKEKFEEDEEVDKHLVDPAGCSVNQEEPPDGISAAMQKALKNRKSTNPNQPQSGRWKEIYRMLFPGHDVPEPWFVPVQDLIELDEFEAYFQQELPKVIQSHSKKEVCKDQTSFDDTLKTIQYFHGLVLSNYRSQRTSEPTIDCGNSTSSTRDPSALISSIDLPSAPTESDGTSYIISEANADTTIQAVQWDPSEELFEVQRSDFGFTSQLLPAEFEDFWEPFT